MPQAVTSTYTADLKRLAKGLTVHVQFKRKREWRWRMTLASWLFRLAAWVMWVNLDIEVVD